MLPSFPCTPHSQEAGLLEASVYLQSIQPTNEEQGIQLTASSLILRFEKSQGAWQANAPMSQCSYLRIKGKVKTSFNVCALLLHMAEKSLGHKYSLSCLDPKSYDIIRLYSLLIAWARINDRLIGHCLKCLSSQISDKRQSQLPQEGLLIHCHPHPPPAGAILRVVSERASPRPSWVQWERVGGSLSLGTDTNSCSFHSAIVPSVT